MRSLFGNRPEKDGQMLRKIQTKHFQFSGYFSTFPVPYAFHFYFQGNISRLHLKRSSVQMQATLRAQWALLFWPTWPAAVDRTLFLDERMYTSCCCFCAT